MTFIIQHERDKCIGCGACAAVASEFWDMNSPDGKPNLVGAKKVEDVEQLEAKDMNANKDAAEACPVNAIHVIKKESGEKII